MSFPDSRPVWRVFVSEWVGRFGPTSERRDERQRKNGPAAVPSGGGADSPSRSSSPGRPTDGALKRGSPQPPPAPSAHAAKGPFFHAAKREGRADRPTPTHAGRHHA